MPHPRALAPILTLALCLSAEPCLSADLPTGSGADLSRDLRAAAGVDGAAPGVAPLDVSFDDVVTLEGREPDSVIRYGPAPSQRLLHWRSRGAAAVGTLVLLHGGCWLSEYGVEYTFPLAAALADRGYAVWAPEYRRVGEPGGGWPGTFEDVMSALDLASDNSSAGGAVVLIGHSAGGHLALWSAARPGFDPGHPLYRAGAARPRAVIGLAAITDLAVYGAGDGSCQQAVPQLMGGSAAEQPGRYALASPATLTLAARVTLLQGSADSIVPLAQARAIPDARLRLLAGAGHFDPVHPGTAAFTVLLEELEALFKHD